MDSFSSFFQSHSSSRSRWSYDSLKNFRQISPVVQKYLKQVYLMLCCALIASAVGVYMHLLWCIGDFLTTVGCIGSMIWLLSTPPYEEKKRVALLMAAALFEGASVGPLVDLAIEIDPSYYQALGWQIVAAKIGMQRCVASSQWLNEKISLSRYAHRDLMAQFVDDSLHEVVGFRKAWHGLVLLAPKGHGICLAQASRIRFEFHKGAADHTFMRNDGEPWKQPLPVDDDTAVVEISHLCQVNMLATQDCRSRSVYDPSTPSSHQGDDEDSNEEDSGEDWEERRKFGAADTFRILTMSDISQLKNLSLPPPGDLESGIEA